MGFVDGDSDKTYAVRSCRIGRVRQARGNERMREWVEARESVCGIGRCTGSDRSGCGLSVLRVALVVL